MKRRGFLQSVAAAIAFVSAAASGFGAAVTNVCSKLAPVKRRLILPPIPKWSQAVDDIDRADYMRRSEDFERSLLPKDLTFPREGQVWEVVRDCEVCGHNVVANRMVLAPIPLRKGERVRILPLGHPKPLQVMFRRIKSKRQAALSPYRWRGRSPGKAITTATSTSFSGWSRAECRRRPNDLERSPNDPPNDLGHPFRPIKSGHLTT